MPNTFENERINASQTFAEGAINNQRELTEQEVMNDQMFIDAYKIAGKQMYGEMIEGTNQDLAKDAMQFVADTTIPTMTPSGGGMLGIFTKFQDAPTEAKQALWYMIDTIDKKEMTWNGFARGVKAIGKDPLTYTGVGAGWAFFGKQATKSLFKKRLMEMLIGGASGSAYTGADEFLRQDLQDKRDWGEVATATGLGTVMGAFAPPVVVGATKAVKAVGKKATAVAPTIAVATQDEEQ